MKAWGIRSAGSLSGAVAPHGREGTPSLSCSSSASSLRRAFVARGVELAWAGPLGGENADDGRDAADADGRVWAAAAGNGNAGAFDGGGGRRVGTFGSGEGGDGGEESGAAEAGVAAVEGWTEDGPRHACRLGCGAWPKSGDAVDHVEVNKYLGVFCSGFEGGRTATLRRQAYRNQW